MFDEIVLNKWKIIIVLAIVFVILTVISLFVPTFDFFRDSNSQFLLVQNTENTITRVKIIVPYSLAAISVLVLLILSKTTGDINQYVFLIVTIIMLLTTTYIIININSFGTTEYRKENIQYMFIRYFMLLDVILIILTYYSDKIQDKLS